MAGIFHDQGKHYLFAPVYWESIVTPNKTSHHLRLLSLQTLRQLQYRSKHLTFSFINTIRKTRTRMMGALYRCSISGLSTNQLSWWIATAYTSYLGDYAAHTPSQSPQTNYFMTWADEQEDALFAFKLVVRQKFWLFVSAKDIISDDDWCGNHTFASCTQMICKDGKMSCGGFQREGVSP